MGLDKPEGDYVERMTEPNGWPNFDEDTFYERETLFNDLATSLQGAIDSWDSNRSKIFDTPKVWTGDSSDSARVEVENRKTELDELKQKLLKAAEWHSLAGDKLKEVKELITDIVLKAHSDIGDVLRDKEMSEKDKKDEIDKIVKETLAKTQAEITKAITGLGLPVPDSPDDKAGSDETVPSGDPNGAPAPPEKAPEEQVVPVGVPTPSPGAGPPVPPARIDSEPINPATGDGTPDHPQPIPAGSAEPTSAPDGGPSGGPVSIGSAGSPGSPGTPGTPTSQGSSSIAPTSPASTDETTSAADAKADPNAPQTPLEAMAKALGQQQQPLTPQGGGASAPTAQPIKPELSAPTSAAPVTTSSGSAGASGGSGPAAPVSAPVGGATPTSPTPPMPLGPPTSPPPAAPLPPAAGGASGPGVSPMSAGASSNNAAGAAPVPVSAMRAERDAIATAATAGALRRLSDSNPAMYGRRIAAALAVTTKGFGFFWVTGVTSDGMIVVANSYGLAYIPDGVNLPENIVLATADATIPLADRAAWATYPVLAVEGWARFHEKQLRMVIGSEEHLKNSDPGAAKIYLDPEDLPADGKMTGRDRLEVVAPPLSQRLASVVDAVLHDLLPPASVDDAAPEDRSTILLFEAAKPLMSSMGGRGVAHLKAWLTYVDHRAELALYAAHHATEAITQRAAISEWAYWQYLGDLVNEALAVGATP